MQVGGSGGVLVEMRVMWGKNSLFHVSGKQIFHHVKITLGI